MIYGWRARSPHFVENPVVSVSQTQIRIEEWFIISIKFLRNKEFEEIKIFRNELTYL